MIDMKTKQRVVVDVHPEYGPFVRLASYQDVGAVEDELDDNFYVLYWTEPIPEFKDEGGCVFYFGNAADPAKLQAIFDGLQFSWSPQP